MEYRDLQAGLIQGGDAVERGKIVVINGVPSSGKTTLSKVLQARFPDQYFLIPVDILNVLSPPKDSLSYHARFYSDPKPAVSAVFGCVKAFSDNGLNVILDASFNDINYPFDTFLKTFPDCDYPVSVVLVTCHVDELRRREKLSGDREIGLGERMMAHLDPQGPYDLTVDTFSSTLEYCAEKIIKLMDYPEKWTAFKTLWTERQNKA
jgi:chloramphenicol 3-O phosphotransferase